MDTFVFQRKNNGRHFLAEFLKKVDGLGKELNRLIIGLACGRQDSILGSAWTNEHSQECSSYRELGADPEYCGV